MKIISKFHDYYDNIRVHGIDTNYLYHRETKILEQEKDVHKFKTILANKYNYNFYDRDNKHEIIIMGYVLFCGKLYPYIKTSYRHSGTYNEHLKLDSDYMFHYSLDHYDTYLKSIYGEDWFKNYKKSGAKDWFDSKNIKKVEEHFNTLIADTVIQELHRLHNTPVIMIAKEQHKFKVVLNPILKDIEFYRVVDNYTAFQELSMYVGGVLSNTATEILELDDEIKVAKHGFNKWSFRKQKESNHG